MRLLDRIRRAARLWWKSAATGYGRAVTEADDRHLRLDEAFTQCAGQWVAVNRSTGHVVAAAPTPYELSAYIKDKGIRGVEMLRAPALGEPEVVGFG